MTHIITQCSLKLYWASLLPSDRLVIIAHSFHLEKTLHHSLPTLVQVECTTPLGQYGTYTILGLRPLVV